MSRYGAKYLQWAPFKDAGADEDPQSFPKYGTPQNLGPLVVVNDSITTAEPEDYGDDGLQDSVTEFQKLDIEVEVTELPLEAAVPMFGATKTVDGDIEFGAEDAAPWGGLGFFVSKRVKGKKCFQGIFYPKVMASRQGASYNTKGQSITFAHDKLKLKGAACKKGKYQVTSALLDTEDEAKAWVDGKIKASV